VKREEQETQRMNREKQRRYELETGTQKIKQGRREEMGKNTLNEVRKGEEQEQEHRELSARGDEGKTMN